MANIKVLLADDHPLILEGLKAALTKRNMRVIGETGSAEEVVRLFRQCRPDVLVLDLRFGQGATGMDVARSLLSKEPEARIVFYSQFDQNEVIREAYRLGAAAYVTKNQPPGVLATAIEEAARGKTYFVPAIAERLALLGVRGDESPRSRLDAREAEVFVQLANGLTNNEIAERMSLSSKTIGVIAQAIREKLGVQRAAEMTRLAVRYGMIDP
ncbi:MAG: response regulator transcription factor [Ideonella sp.]|nr:response regulator transcription factor [Ideonella sp.]MCC7458029.1 response regulator transcription factor [Nitrospira sp.]